MGARIETREKAVEGCGVATVAPSWGRGLKRLLGNSDKQFLQVAPSWGRGLKHFGPEEGRRDPESPPHGGAD